MKRMSLASQYSSKKSDPTELSYYSSILDLPTFGAQKNQNKNYNKKHEVRFPYMKFEKSTRKRLLVTMGCLYYFMALSSIVLRMWYWHHVPTQLIQRRFEREYALELSCMAGLILVPLAFVNAAISWISQNEAKTHILHLMFICLVCLFATGCFVSAATQANHIPAGNKV